MLQRLIHWSLHNHFPGVLLLTLLTITGGIYAVMKTRWMPFRICQMCR